MNRQFILNLISEYDNCHRHSVYTETKSYNKETGKVTIQPMTIFEWVQKQEDKRLEETEKEYKEYNYNTFKDKNEGLYLKELDYTCRDIRVLENTDRTVARMKHTKGKAIYRHTRAYLKAIRGTVKLTRDQEIKIDSILEPMDWEERVEWSREILYLLGIMNLKLHGEYSPLQADDVFMGMQKKVGKERTDGSS